MLACVAGLSAVSTAQEDRPQIIPGERQVPRKKDAGPRALALLRLSPDGKSSLLPVAILINGKFWDASAYKADPIPMALDYGVVYEAERTGSSLGLFTVSSALHSNVVNAQIPWIATGKWAPAGAEDAKKPLKAESVPVGVDPADDRPRLTRDPAAAKAAPPASAAPDSKPSSGGSNSGDEPPRLSRGSSAPTSSAPASSPPSPSSSAPSSSAPSGSKPPASPSGTDSKAGDPKPAAPPSGPADDSGVNEATRPRLRRGKPVEAFPDEDIPGYSKPGAAAAATITPASAGKTAQPTASGPAQLFPAISDASGPAPHSFTFQWLKDEKGERRKQMQALATQQVQAYIEALARNKISASPKPSGAQGAHRTPSRKMPLPILENVQMIAYDMWTNGEPVLVFAADAHQPPAAGTAHAGTNTDVQYSIMMVARTDIYNNLHPLYVGVTDKYHLDVTPRLELIDAVDADGDGRGELLFRETTDAGTGWVVYRATTDKLWKMFDSLNPL